MNRFIVYTRLRLKAVLKIFPSMCVMTFLLCLSLGGMLYLHRSKEQIEGFALAILPLILLFQALLTVAGVSISNRRFMAALRRTLREAARQH